MSTLLLMNTFNQTRCLDKQMFFLDVVILRQLGFVNLHSNPASTSTSRQPTKQRLACDLNSSVFGHMFHCHDRFYLIWLLAVLQSGLTSGTGEKVLRRSSCRWFCVFLSEMQLLKLSPHSGCDCIAHEVGFAGKVSMYIRTNLQLISTFSTLFNPFHLSSPTC